MNLKLASVVGIVGLSLVVGCGARNKNDDEGATLGESEAQLVSDNDEASDVDENAEVGIEESLSGGQPAAPADVDPSSNDADLQQRVRTNPGAFFQPAGCLTTTLAGNVATHVFVNCTGPYGMKTFNGTITSTYVLEAGKLTVTHETSGFSVNGATVSGSRTVVYTRSGGVVTRTRTGSWTGTTGKGNAITHEASFVSTYDLVARCVTRDGTSTTTIGDRSFSRTVDGYKRCGIGNLGCPESGTIVLTRTKDNTSLSLTVEFTGGRGFTVTRPNGATFDRQLVCREQ